MSREELVADIESGKAQEHIDSGLTAEDMRRKYGVSEHVIKGYTSAGMLDFGGRGAVRIRNTTYHTWSDAKWLALCKEWV